MADDLARKHLSVGFIRSSREGWNHGIRHRCTFRANGSKRIAEIDLFRGYVGSIRGFRSRLFDGFLVSRTQSTLLFLCEGHRLGVRYAAACGVLSMRNVACHPRPMVTWLAGSFGVFLPRSSPLHPLSLFDPPSSSCRRYSYSLSRFVGRTRTGRSLIRMREANGNSLGHPIVRRRKETTKKGSRCKKRTDTARLPPCSNNCHLLSPFVFMNRSLDWQTRAAFFSFTTRGRNPSWNGNRGSLCTRSDNCRGMHSTGLTN